MRRHSFIQGDSESMKKVTDALQGLLDAASVNVMDKVKIQSLLQSQSESGDMDLANALQPAGAPDPAACAGRCIAYVVGSTVLVAAFMFGCGRQNRFTFAPLS